MQQKPAKSETVIGLLLAVVTTPLAMYLGALQYGPYKRHAIDSVWHLRIGTPKDLVYWRDRNGEGAFETNKMAVGYSVGYILGGIWLSLWSYIVPP